MCSLARQFVLTFAVSGLCSVYLSAQSAASVGPIRIKVVIVTMFERGEDTDDVRANFSSGWNVSISTRFFRSLPAITSCA
jgi:hypothetical protein